MRVSQPVLKVRPRRRGRWRRFRRSIRSLTSGSIHQVTVVDSVRDVENGRIVVVLGATQAAIRAVIRVGCAREEEIVTVRAFRVIVIRGTVLRSPTVLEPVGSIEARVRRLIVIVRRLIVIVRRSIVIVRRVIVRRSIVIVRPSIEPSPARSATRLAMVVSIGTRVPIRVHPSGTVIGRSGPQVIVPLVAVPSTGTDPPAASVRIERGRPEHRLRSERQGSATGSRGRHPESNVVTAPDPNAQVGFAPTWDPSPTARNPSTVIGTPRSVRRTQAIAGPHAQMEAVPWWPSARRGDP